MSVRATERFCDLKQGQVLNEHTHFGKPQVEGIYKWYAEENTKKHQQKIWDIFSPFGKSVVQTQ